jgi:outer membrane biosynthesis protein TonB
MSISTRTRPRTWASSLGFTFLLPAGLALAAAPACRSQPLDPAAPQVAGEPNADPDQAESVEPDAPLENGGQQPAQPAADQPGAPAQNPLPRNPNPSPQPVPRPDPPPNPVPNPPPEPVPTPGGSAPGSTAA